MIAFIDMHRDQFGVEAICRILGATECGFITSRGYRAAKSRPACARSIRDEMLVEEVKRIHKENYSVYGVRQMWHAMQHAGWDVGRDQVARLMRIAGLQGVRRGRKPVTTRPGAGPDERPDLVERKFAADRPRQLWVADITYVRILAGFCYVAFITDVFSRRIVGWAVAPTLHTQSLPLLALEHALLSTGASRNDSGLVHHSDRGSQGGFNWWTQHLRSRRVLMGRPAGWLKELTGRSAMISPGAPKTRRSIERRFWKEIATGSSSEDAAGKVGVSAAVGARWFRQGGGMRTIELTEPGGRYLSFPEREEIAVLHAQQVGVREIARRINRDPATISRELRRNAATRGGKLEYRASVAQWKAELMARRPKTAKLVANPKLRNYVQDRLSGDVCHPDGSIVAGPDVPAWKGRSKPRRADRRWVTAWSPEQISHRLEIDYPEDESMRISHEAIYQSLFIEGRGALKRELVACLRTGRSLRVPRARSKNKPQGHVTEDVVLSERPAEAADRAVPGHWEGDLIIGTNRSAIGTVIERKSRATLLVHLPRLDGYGQTPRVKNGPALAGYGAVAMNAALTASMTTLPQQLRKTLTWDRGKELSGHAQFTVETGTKVFFADPHSPWQRPTNENTNGLLRQYFPKGTDLSRWTAQDLEAVALAVNNRPRKVLDWKSPAEVFAEQLQSLEQEGVASTD